MAESTGRGTEGDPLKLQEAPMSTDGFWRGCGIPVLLSLGVFNALNALWNSPTTGDYVKVLPYPVEVHMLAGSGLALFLLWRATRAGWVGRGEAGLDLSGWSAPKRLAGLTVLVILVCLPFALVASQAGSGGSESPPALTWGDYCFWYVFLLVTSLAEVLVFVSVCFCLGEAWLRRRGVGPVPAWAAAALLASVAYGLHHFTHEPRWHPYALPLTGEMLALLVFFGLTRNLTLTLVVHNAYATKDFVLVHPTGDPLQKAFVEHPPLMVMLIIAFLVPFILLHWLEWKIRPAAGTEGTRSRPSAQTEPA
jgi:hypothetical protein